MLPTNASQDLYPENTITDYRVELPNWMVLTGNDYEAALASFIYPPMWYNVPDTAGQLHTNTFTLPAGTPPLPNHHSRHQQQWLASRGQHRKSTCISLPWHQVHQELQRTLSPMILRDHQVNHSWSEQPCWWEPYDVPFQLSRPQEPCHGDLQAWPERLYGLGDVQVGAVPVSGLAGQGDSAPRLEQNVSPGTICTQVRRHGQHVCALQPSCWCSHGG